MTRPAARPAASPPRSGPSRAGSRRGGFTLIELLIVIGLIALLIGLLTPAIYNATRTANTAAVRSEMSGFEAGIMSFHEMYGRTPPSSIDLRRNAAGVFVNPSTMSTLRSLFGTAVNQTAMVQSLNRMGFPGQNATGPGDSSKGGVLKGAEALVLFLGGLPASGDVPGPNAGVPTKELAGWSKNPRDPFNVAVQSPGTFVLLDRQRRTKPFFQFLPDRLMRPSELGTAGEMSYYSYVDRLEGQRLPLLYASSDGGRGYEDSDVQYTSEVFKNPDGSQAMAGGLYETPDGSPINPNGFQIISPGADGAFGVGGVYSTDDGLTSFGNPRDGGEDNVTNFSTGTLGG